MSFRRDHPDYTPLFPGQKAPPQRKLPPEPVIAQAIEWCVRNLGDFNIKKMKLLYQGLPMDQRQLKWVTIGQRYEEEYGRPLSAVAREIKARVANEQAAPDWSDLAPD